MLERIVRITSRYNMFAPGHRVGVAVSGGIDSVVLLDVLCELQERLGIHLAVVHVNHMLRGEASVLDEDFVAGLARLRGLPFHHIRCNALEGNIEEAAREARRKFFHSLLAGDLDRIATGHTANDQAETVLFRFLRGTGPSGLSAMQYVTPAGIVRPLLAVSRLEIEEYAASRQLQWRVDETNLSRDFTRNRIRHDLIPQLCESYNPALLQQLIHVASIAQDEEAFWQSYLAPLAQQLLTASGHAIIIDCRLFHPLPVAAQRRLLRIAFERVKGDLRQVEFSHVETARLMTGGPDGHGRAQFPGLDVIRSFDWIRISPLPAPAPPSRYDSAPLQVPGDTRLSDSLAVRTTVCEGTPPETSYNDDGNGVWLLAPENVYPPAVLRYWLPGDAYQPAGYSKVEKLKHLFQAARIPLWERRFWPIIESGNRILWSRRFGASQADSAFVAFEQPTVPGTVAGSGSPPKWMRVCEI